MGIVGGVAAVGAAGAIGGALISSSAAGSAANKQQSEDQAAIAQQQTQLAQEQANEAPYLESGSGALAKLNALYGVSTPTVAATGASAAGMAANSGTATGSYKNAAGGASTVNPDASFYLSPDFNFNLTQGLKGLTAQGAATSGLDNGAQQKAEIQYAGNLASENYNQYVTNLQNLAGLGASAAGQVNNATSTTSGNISSTQQTAGSNASASTLAQGQIDAGLLSNLTNTATGYLNSNPGTSGSAAAIANNSNVVNPSLTGAGVSSF